MRQRLDQALVVRGLAPTRSQAEHYVRLGQVLVNGKPATKAGALVSETDGIRLSSSEHYVSRAGLKLASIASMLALDFRDKTVLDVGSSTGGFTDYALRHGARKVIAVDVGTEQLHPSLRSDRRIELYEQTDIRDVCLKGQAPETKSQEERLVHIDQPDIIVVDVSFISLREVLPHVSCLMTLDSILVAMAKPQFEAGASNIKHKGVIKNDRMRREVLHAFELWAARRFVVVGKADSAVPGAKGNLERFYALRLGAR